MIKVRALLGVGVLVAALSVVGAGTASAANPIGHVDAMNYDIKYNTIDIAGWAGDADHGSRPTRVHVYLDGVGAASIGTDVPRPDVAAVHPGLGPRTGFFTQVAQPRGRGLHQVCVYAINDGPGSNVLLECRIVDVTWPTALLGHLDSIGVDPADATGRIVNGWVLDPYDAQSSTPFALVRSSGPTAGFSFDYLEGSADLSRPDVDRAYPHNGHGHGFSIRFRPADVDWLATDRICLAQRYWVPGWIGGPTTTCITYAG